MNKNMKLSLRYIKYKYQITMHEKMNTRIMDDEMINSVDILLRFFRVLCILEIIITGLHQFIIMTIKLPNDFE